MRGRSKQDFDQQAAYSSLFGLVFTLEVQLLNVPCSQAAQQPVC
jgi:hypothetical protein